MVRLLLSFHSFMEANRKYVHTTASTRLVKAAVSVYIYLIQFFRRIIETSKLFDVISFISKAHPVRGWCRRSADERTNERKVTNSSFCLRKCNSSFQQYLRPLID